MTSLGCPFACSYCHIAHETKGSLADDIGKFRIKSDERVLEELLYLRDTIGAKTAINPETLFDKVTLPDGGTFERAEKIKLSARQTVKLRLDTVRNQLDELSKAQAFTSNFVTTQIQAINRGVKEQYVAETQNLVQGRKASFDDMNTLIIKSTGINSSLKLYIIQSIDRKLPLNDIANAKGMDMVDFIKELESIVFSGTKLNIDYWIDEIFDEILMKF